MPMRGVLQPHHPTKQNDTPPADTSFTLFSIHTHALPLHSLASDSGSTVTFLNTAKNYPPSPKVYSSRLLSHSPFLLRIFHLQLDSNLTSGSKLARWVNVKVCGYGVDILLQRDAALHDKFMVALGSAESQTTLTPKLPKSGSNG